ncbi:hypothetical protein C7H09_11685 [Marinobacter fuscus]|uniref:Uncharacterized protein n=1 Tax=Marinobacter fuscus TaxID=2109942 RepID=A0A2T1K7C1_9GAMM|nr:hypothetical protein C7H09_11685 [Marinobacter fuscus]
MRVIQVTVKFLPTSRLVRNPTPTHRKGFGVGFPKISKAKDGLREAHMDVLVAVFGKPTPKAFEHQGQDDSTQQNEEYRDNGG